MGVENGISGMTRLCVPEGLKLTRGAHALIERADQAGVPRGVILQRVLGATRRAEEQGRHRVGPFGGMNSEFESLRLATIQKQQESLLIRRPPPHKPK